MSTPIQKVAAKSGKSEKTVYAHAEKTHRLPTVNEMKSTKTGRPIKYGK